MVGYNPQIVHENVKTVSRCQVLLGIVLWPLWVIGGQLGCFNWGLLGFAWSCWGLLGTVGDLWGRWMPQDLPQFNCQPKLPRTWPMARSLVKDRKRVVTDRVEAAKTRNLWFFVTQP